MSYMKSTSTMLLLLAICLSLFFHGTGGSTRASSRSIVDINVTYVAQDGSGNYRTIGAAIANAPDNSVSRVIIKIKPGIYRENIVVPPKKTMLTLLGYGMDKTIVTGDRSNKTGFGTYETATAAIHGPGFAAIGINFQNTAGPSNGQAVALLSETQSAFYQCRFMGYQDTIYAKQSKQFYRNCEVYGTIDFIFGDASAVFQNCAIIVGKPLLGQFNTITAQGRENPTSKGGFIFQNCIIKGAPDLPSTVKTYFGRPWRIYSRVVIMQSQIGQLIDPLGWARWDSTSQVDKLLYAEYQNKGPGANILKRVNWPGRIELKTARQVSLFTVRNFIQGDKWIPSGIPFYLDL